MCQVLGAGVTLKNTGENWPERPHFPRHPRREESAAVIWAIQMAWPIFQKDAGQQRHLLCKPGSLPRIPAAGWWLMIPLMYNQMKSLVFHPTNDSF